MTTPPSFTQEEIDQIHAELYTVNASNQCINPTHLAWIRGYNNVQVAQPKFNILEDTINSLHQQQRPYFAELEKKIVARVEELTDDQELYLVEERIFPKLSVTDAMAFRMEMSIGYEPLIVKKGTDVSRLDFVKNLSEDCVVYGPITKEAIEKLRVKEG